MKFFKSIVCTLILLIAYSNGFTQGWEKGITISNNLYTDSYFGYRINLIKGASNFLMNDNIKFDHWSVTGFTLKNDNVFYIFNLENRIEGFEFNGRYSNDIRTIISNREEVLINNNTYDSEYYDIEKISSRYERKSFIIYFKVTPKASTKNYCTIFRFISNYSEGNNKNFESEAEEIVNSYEPTYESSNQIPITDKSINNIKGIEKNDNSVNSKERNSNGAEKENFPEIKEKIKIVETFQVNNNAVAVIIGNKNYSKKDVPHVDYAIEDAVLMKEYLMKTLGFKEENILYYSDATQSDFYSIFGKENNYKGLLYNYVKPNKSDVFIYYSGHGAPDPESKTGYFVPVDCNPNTVALNGFSLGLFYSNLSQIQAKSFTIILDACFSGGYENGMLLKNISPIFITADESQLPEINGTVFSSSKGDQVSSWYPEKKHSLFTYYYVKGMGGEADENKDNKISLSEIKSYLEENVTYMARRLNNRTQNPQIKGDENKVLLEF